MLFCPFQMYHYRFKIGFLSGSYQALRGGQISLLCVLVSLLYWVLLGLLLGYCWVILGFAQTLTRRTQGI